MAATEEDIKEALDGLEQRIDKVHQGYTEFYEGLEERGYSNPEEFWGDVEAVPEVRQAVTSLQDDLEELQTRLNRPGGYGASEEEREAEAKRQAFLKATRFGVDGARSKLEPEEQRLLQTDAQDQGGFLVPEPVMGDMIDAIVEISPIRANASVQTLQDSDTLEIPEVDGRFAAAWVGERESRPETTDTSFTMHRIPLNELYAFPHATQKMLNDAGFNVESFIQSKVSEAFAFLTNKAYVDGSGNGEPEGILTNSQLDTDKLTTASGSSLDADDVLDLIYDLKSMFRGQQQLFAHRQIILHLRKLTDSNGQYLWQPSLQADNPATFAGVPIVETPDLPSSVTTGNKVLFTADLARGYTVVNKNQAQMLRDPYTSKPKVGFYMTTRWGGGVTQSEAIRIMEVS